jgi:hypothetical protein
VAAINARLLLALVMALAAAWKVLTPSYMDGSYFQFALSVDARFNDFSQIVAGMSEADLESNLQQAVTLLTGYRTGEETTAVPLTVSPRLRYVATFLTWWTIIMEGAMAVLFFLPFSSTISVIRNATLLVFAVTTYAVAPVVGFGWLLMILGITQANRPQDGAWRVGYLAAFVLIRAYDFPFAETAHALWQEFVVKGA